MAISFPTSLGLKLRPIVASLFTRSNSDPELQFSELAPGFQSRMFKSLHLKKQQHFLSKYSQVTCSNKSQLPSFCSLKKKIQWRACGNTTFRAIYLSFLSLPQVVESCLEGVCKPDPRIYKLCLERLGLQPSESIFLDDLGQNVKAAASLGMHTIKVMVAAL